MDIATIGVLGTLAVGVLTLVVGIAQLIVMLRK